MENFIFLFGGIGIGAWIGNIIQHFLEKDRRKVEMLFEARRNAYKDILGRLHNSLIDPELVGISDFEKKLKINRIFSEVELLAGTKLNDLINTYTSEFNWLIKDGKKLPKGVHSDEHAERYEKFLLLGIEVEIEMRRELGIK